MSQARSTERLRVFMMDLWSTVPYYTAYLSRALLKQGVDVQIGAITYYLDRKCFTSRNLKLQPGISDQVGQRELPRAARRVLKLAEGVANLAALTLHFARQPPEVVHVQFLPLLRSRLPFDLWFIRYCKKRGSKLVLTVHDLLPHDTGQEFLAVYRRLYAEVDGLICHSAHIRDRLLLEFQVSSGKISVIPHGPFFFDLPRAEAEAERRSYYGKKVILWQGILFPYKGVDLLLSAWKRVEAQAPDALLVVLGTGDPALLASLQQQAADLQLHRVRFDFRFCSAEELVAAYRSATAVAYPYRAITTSGALATGLSLGKALVASNLPVFRELLTNGVNALLVDPADPSQLAEALLRVLNDPELSARLEQAVQAMRFGEQSWTEIAEATVDVYRRTLTDQKT